MTIFVEADLGNCDSRWMFYV